MPPLLDVRDLQIRFGAADAVRRVNLPLDVGQVRGLDVTVQVLELLREPQQQHGLATLFISHDRAEVGHAANRVAVMRSGLVVETGTSARLLTHPEHAYTKTLLAAVPTLRTDRDQPLAMVHA